MSQKSSYLLPSSVVPANYEVTLWPDFENFTFDGVVAVDLSIRESVHSITMHALELKFDSSDVELWLDARTEPIVCQEVRFDESAQTVTLVFAEEIRVGSVAYLEIKYKGILNDQMAGFYRSKYKTADGQEKYLACTQFEATDARRALPCWDEPARKATFDVRLVVPSNLVALSNMPVKSTEFVGRTDHKDVRFERTPVMSTYLLAFVVGEFEYIETQTNNGTLVRVYTMPDKTYQGKFALEVGRNSLELYNDYFDTAYPLPKLDMIAIPDFAAGAMENWGLVTYRENALLIDEANSSVAAKQRVAEVVAHELAHQWFGNIVTMEWWTNLWLNEGFATWMANFVLDKLFPQWDIWTQFVADDYASAMSLDGLRSTHPIEVPVENPDDIGQIFDAISYSKGCAIIRMIHDFIGPDAFRAGLRVYLKRHAYGNAVTEDLWKALEEASGQPVQKIMDTWTKQPGYPLIKVLKDRDKGMCVLWQDRFLASGTLTEEEEDQTWQIPLVAHFNHSSLDKSDDAKWEELEKSGYAKTIFSGKVGHLPNKGKNLLKLNSNQVAIARVNYLPEQWQALAEAVSRGQLGAADRYGILSDALSLARAGHLSTAQLIRLVSAYRNEDNYTVWMEVLAVLGALDNILEETPESSELAALARHMLQPIVEKLGWQESADEPHTAKLLREVVLYAFGNYGDEKTIAEAKDRFFDHVHEVSVANPNFRKPIYGLTAKYGSKVAFDAMVEMYRKETFQEERVRLLAALGRFTDSEFLPTVLEYTFNSGEVRSGDVFYPLSTLGTHAGGRRAAWKFLTQNWETIHKRYSSGGMKILGRIVSLVCGNFARMEDAQAVEEFFKNNPAPSATRAVAESLEYIRVRAAWYERDKEDIITALKGE